MNIFDSITLLSQVLDDMRVFLPPNCSIGCLRRAHRFSGFMLTPPDTLDMNQANRRENEHPVWLPAGVEGSPSDHSQRLELIGLPAGSHYMAQAELSLSPLPGQQEYMSPSCISTTPISGDSRTSPADDGLNPLYPWFSPSGQSSLSSPYTLSDNTVEASCLPTRRIYDPSQQHINRCYTPSDLAANSQPQYTSHLLVDSLPYPSTDFQSLSCPATTLDSQNNATVQRPQQDLTYRPQHTLSIPPQPQDPTPPITTTSSKTPPSPQTHQRQPSPTSTDLTKYGLPMGPDLWRCAHPGCTSQALFRRGCDLRKHFNRHRKHLFCRFEECPQSRGGGFSSKKDRARHEAKHNPGVGCEWSGCERIFSRVDNMKDHVRRIHRRV